MHKHDFTQTKILSDVSPDDYQFYLLSILLKVDEIDLFPIDKELSIEYHHRK